MPKGHDKLFNKPTLGGKHLLPRDKIRKKWIGGVVGKKTINANVVHSTGYA